MQKILNRCRANRRASRGMDRDANRRASRGMDRAANLHATHCFTVMHTLWWAYATKKGRRMQATLNVRMDAALKERGDRVLREGGVSTSEAVRALWAHLAATRELPDFLMKASSQAAESARKKAALAALAGVGEGACTNLTDEEMARIYEARYE